MSLNNLAELYRVQGRFDEAAPLYERALAVAEAALGPDHPDVALTLNGLAELHRAHGDYEAAEPEYARALAIREKALGSDHPDVARPWTAWPPSTSRPDGTTEAKRLRERARDDPGDVEAAASERYSMPTSNWPRWAVSPF